MLKLKPITIALCLLGFVSIPVFAQNQGISSRTQQLESEVAELQKEVAELRAGSRGSVTETRYAEDDPKKYIKPDDTNTAAIPLGNAPHGKVCAAKTSMAKPVPAPTLNARQATILQQQAAATAEQPQIAGPQYLPQAGVQYLPLDVSVPGQSFVSTGPYVGVPLQYSGGDLIINNPSVNQDVALLNLRKNIIERLQNLGLKSEDMHSHLLLSGIVEGQAIYKDIGGGPNKTDIDLTNAALDMYILGPSTFTSGLITLQYDNNIGAQEGSLSNNSRSQNSRFFLDKAFIILGDLTQSPWYGTIGQMYVPFGVYSNTYISSPLTKLMFRTQARAILVGFQQQTTNALYGSAYIFKGDSYVGATSRVSDGGLNLGYRYSKWCFSSDIGGGVLGNIADSQGMQNNGNGAVYVAPASPVFGGFGAVAGTGNEQIVHRVPAYDAHALLSIGKEVDLYAEYLTASTRFNPNDLTMKSNGAKPQALDAEATYTFQTTKPLSVTLGYGFTKDALALDLPAQRWTVALNTSWWRNTLQSLEFRRDRNYAESAYATGSTIPALPESGKIDHVITAQFDIYF